MLTGMTERDWRITLEVFDAVHAQGGLTGYAHVNSGMFHVHRDMSLNVPRQKLDFVEILQFNQLGTDLYYDFLNLGCKLTASAGSDVPWGGTIGEVRAYAYLGEKEFTADNWFEAFGRGRTFTTSGSNPATFGTGVPTVAASSAVRNGGSKPGRGDREKPEGIGRRLPQPLPPLRKSAPRPPISRFRLLLAMLLPLSVSLPAPPTKTLLVPSAQMESFPSPPKSRAGTARPPCSPMRSSPP